MPAHQETDEAIENFGVEAGAQKMLLRDRQWRLQTEDRVRRDDAGGNDGGDEGVTIADGGDIAVAEPRMIERTARQRR